MVAEASILETWRAFKFKLPCEKHFTVLPSHLPTRAARNEELKIPVVKNSHKDWFVYKASRLGN